MAKKSPFFNKYAGVKLEALPPPKPKKEEVEINRRPLSVSELAAYVGWTRSKIDRYVKAGLIPFHKIGNSYPFYYLDEVLDALKNNTRSNEQSHKDGTAEKKIEGAQK